MKDSQHDGVKSGLGLQSPTSIETRKLLATLPATVSAKTDDARPLIPTIIAARSHSLLPKKSRVLLCEICF
jgi:hypothetical protein